MYQIEKQVRDNIVNFLQTQVVSANVGAGLMEVARILSTLKEVEVKQQNDGDKGKTDTK